jgi:hypothetical protein
MHWLTVACLPASACLPAAFKAETKEKAKKKTEQQAGGKKRKATDKAEGAAGEWGRLAGWLACRLARWWVGGQGTGRLW